MTNEIKTIVKNIAAQFSLEEAALLAFIEVESGGQGFNAGTGKIVIQFEPVWMKRLAPYSPSGKWSVNKVDVQSKEWEAFSDAFGKDPDAAMKATSIGLGQIMGFHFSRLGYKTVGAMWDDAKKSLERQIWQIAQFIKTDAQLYKALKDKNWHIVALIYNGKGYKDLAKRIGREPYNISLEKAYKKYIV